MNIIIETIVQNIKEIADIQAKEYHKNDPHNIIPDVQDIKKKHQILSVKVESLK